MEEKIKKCLCEEPLCRKCLGFNCEDDNCKIHTIGNKLRAKIIVLNDLKTIVAKTELMTKKGYSEEELNRSYDYKRMFKMRTDIKKYTKEIDRLKKLQFSTK